MRKLIEINPCSVKMLETSLII